MTTGRGSETVLAAGDYVVVRTEVTIEQNKTTLRIAPNSIGRFVRPAWRPEEVVILLGSWHIRVPRAAVACIGASDSSLPFPWVDRFLSEVKVSA